MDFVYIKDKITLGYACDYFAKQEVLGVDTETTGLDGNHNKISLIQISDGKKTVIVDCFVVNDFSRLVEIFENPKIKKVFHNYSFDFKFLRQLGLTCYPVFDTMNADKLIAYDNRHNLKSVLKRWLHVEADKTEQKSDWSIRPLTDEQLEYAANDVLYLPQLREDMLSSMITHKLLKVGKLEFECTPAVALKELAGIAVNKDLYQKNVDKIKELHQLASDNLQKSLKDGNNSTISCGLFEGLPDKDDSNINISSHQQMLSALKRLNVPVAAKSEEELIKQYLKKKTPFAVGTGEKELTPLQGLYPVIDRLFEFRQMDKLLTSYGDNILDKMVWCDDHWRLFASYNQIGAPTGRFSCKNPNLQQVPGANDIEIMGEKYSLNLRECFIFKPGSVGILNDYSQCELRILAHMSQDPNLLKAYRENLDLHAFTAHLIFNMPYEDLIETSPMYKETKPKRYIAKTTNFSICYDISKWGLAKRLGCTEEEAESYIKGWQDAYPVAHECLKEMGNKAINTGESRTLSGRRQLYNLPGTGKQSWGGWRPYSPEIGAIKRNGRNMPIQGCLGGEMRVLVEGEGYKKISEIPKQMHQVWDGRGFVNGMVSESGDKQLMEISLDNGLRIFCSPSHQFLMAKERSRGRKDEVPQRWLTAQKIPRKSRMQISPLVPEFNYFYDTGNKKMNDLDSFECGFLISFILNAYKNGALRIKASYEPKIREIVSKVSKITDLISIPSTTQKRHRYDMYVELPEITEIPEYLFNSTELMKGFLNGLCVQGTFLDHVKLKVPHAWKVPVLEMCIMFGIVAYPRPKVEYLEILIKHHVRRFQPLLKIISIGDNKKINEIFDKQILQSYNGWSIEVKNVRTHKGTSVPMYDVVDATNEVYMTQGIVSHNTNADILKRALKLLYDKLQGFDARVVATVHDEVVVECVEHQAEEVNRIVEQCMVQAGEEYVTTVPIIAEGKIIQNWGEK